ncbi:fungal-specific transcription factor domain-containing protein [Rhodocollybia butyracea]|uniref:Fungal-specific transcription factor domain-containing protein n=1 Tax=Rhodocollybia butyracea TaxID=206335 RepID=A0A9P5UAZ6_9AGAR|nr:fungal-specific transcription factor domain-containing protein [Rhodocollybia butyracea]
MTQADDAPLKKSRTSNACDTCRKRKVKCDSANMPENICSECIKWKTECTHVMGKRKRGPKAAGLFRKPIAHKANLNDLVSSIVDSVDAYTLPEDMRFVKALVIDLALHVRCLEVELKQIRGSTSSSSSSNHSDTPRYPNSVDIADQGGGHSQEVDDLGDPVDPLALNQKHYGGSSTFQLVQNALNVKGELIGVHNPTLAISKRPEFWEVPKWQAYPQPESPPYSFPDPDLLALLVRLFFEKIHPYFPMLHRPSFEKSVSEGLHMTDKGFGAVLLMVCSLASQQSNDLRTLSEGTDSEHSQGWRYYRQIQVVHQPFEDVHSIYEFQLYPLSTLYLHTSNVAGAPFFFIALGMRAAQQKGVHEPQFVVLDNPLETELWKRAFWCLVVLDVYGSTSLGRPRATVAEDFDVAFPQECHDEYREVSDSLFSRKPSIMSFWTHYLKIINIIGFAHKILYSVRKSELWSGTDIAPSDWIRKAVIELDSMLNTWVDSVPAHLIWNPQVLHTDEIFLNQSAMLYATYCWAQFQVHKSFISQSESFPTFPSLTIVANAARVCVNVLEVQHLRQPFVPLPLIIGPLFDSAIVLLMNLWRGLRNMVALDSKKEMDGVYKCIDMLSMFEKRFQVGGRLCDILNSIIISVGKLPPMPERRSMKRTESSSPEDQPSPWEGTSSSAQMHLGSQDHTFHSTHLDSVILPCHSHELGTLPLHSSWDPAPNPSLYTEGALPSHLAVSNDWATALEPYQEDWDSFMEGVDHLLHSIQASNFAGEPNTIPSI